MFILLNCTKSKIIILYFLLYVQFHKQNIVSHKKKWLCSKKHSHFFNFYNLYFPDFSAILSQFYCNPYSNRFFESINLLSSVCSPKTTLMYSSSPFLATDTKHLPAVSVVPVLSPLQYLK